MVKTAHVIDFAEFRRARGSHQPNGKQPIGKQTAGITAPAVVWVPVWMIAAPWCWA